MPELPDITVYLESLERHFLGQPLKKILLDLLMGSLRNLRVHLFSNSI